MARYNRFGATAAQVLAMYPGSVLADYDDGGAAGQAKIEAVLDRIARDVAAALTPEVFRQITEVDCMEVVRYATAGQTTATLGLLPAVTGTMHLWRYPNAELLVNAGSGYATSDAYTRKPRFGIMELTGYAVDLSTGAITSIPALSLGDRVFASYDIDVDNAAFSMPSVADLVVLGAAVELGSKLYSHELQEWKLVDEYRTRYRGAGDESGGGLIGAARAGEWIPDELRKLRYWTDLERASGEINSVRLYRG